MKTIFQAIANRRAWSLGLFWSWNAIFLAFMLLGFAPTVLPEMATAVSGGLLPVQFLVYGIILASVPILAVVLGLTLLRRRPERLFALGYGVEGPLMLILAVRFFVVRQATPAVTAILIIAGLGIAAYLWQILDAEERPENRSLAIVRLVGLTLLLLTGLYASIWLAFYALPLGVQGVSSAGEFVQTIWLQIRNLDWRADWRWLPFFLFGGILFLFSATLFVLMPLAIFLLYTRAWLRGVRAVPGVYGRWVAIGVSAAVMLIVSVLLTQVTRQPQHMAFALLERAPATLAEAEALQEQEAAIRAGLLNAYLAPQRYVSSVGEVQHVSEMYAWALKMDRERARRVQAAYELVAQPILYQPVTPIEPDEWRWDNQAMVIEPAAAAVLYQQYFDQPIVEAERETIVRAARSTWIPAQAQMNWQAVDDREIWLSHQEVTIIEHGDWAEVELYEIYLNQTALQQEVVYYFSLPESAVLTGVWLGDSDDRESRFVYQVAPRGAAQTVYRNEVRRNIDPALLEQIGPSQYRLRIFPIEAQQWTWENGNRSTLTDGPPMHMWLTYQTMIGDEGWPLPYLARKFNVYWDKNSTRLMNGVVMADNETWLPPVAAVNGIAARTAHRVDFANGQSVLVQPAAAGDAPRPAADLQLAVVLDRSRSMADLDGVVREALAELAAWGTAVDVYLTTSPFRGEEPSRVSLAALDTDRLSYFGGQNAAELLAQFSALYQGEPYDAIFVLTDGSGYELGAHEVTVTIPDAPVWMVHLDGHFPIGYDDDTLELVQASGGGSVASVQAGLARLWLGREGRTDLLDGYVWQVVDTADAPNDLVIHAPDDGFAPLAARRLILAEMTANRGQIDQLATLDGLHQLASEYSIVTPYSSMIVLVNDQQRRLLAQLSEQEDRFEREFEEVGQTLPPPTVTGVPEPEEWLLIGLALAALAWAAYQRRQVAASRAW